MISLTEGKEIQVNYLKVIVVYAPPYPQTKGSSWKRRQKEYEREVMYVCRKTLCGRHDKAVTYMNTHHDCTRLAQD